MRKVLRNAITHFTSLVLGGLFAGCAWDNSPPPYHSVINYDPSRSQTFLSSNPPTNAPSTRDWKTNQVAGVGYGSSGSSAAPANTAAAEAAGAASSPSGISTGAGGGTASTGGVSASGGAVAGSAGPGSIIGNPPGTGTIGTTPGAGPPSSGFNQTAGTSPSVGTGLRPATPLGTGILPSSPPPPFTGIGVTNTRSSAIFTNNLSGPTNFFPGFSRPTP